MRVTSTLRVSREARRHRTRAPHAVSRLSRPVHHCVAVRSAVDYSARGRCVDMRRLGDRLVVYRVRRRRIVRTGVGNRPHARRDRHVVRTDPLFTSGLGFCEDLATKDRKQLCFTIEHNIRKVCGPKIGFRGKIKIAND